MIKQVSRSMNGFPNRPRVSSRRSPTASGFVAGDIRVYDLNADLMIFLGLKIRKGWTRPSTLALILKMQAFNRRREATLLDSRDKRRMFMFPDARAQK